MARKLGVCGRELQYRHVEWMMIVTWRGYGNTGRLFVKRRCRLVIGLG